MNNIIKSIPIIIIVIILIIFLRNIKENFIDPSRFDAPAFASDSANSTRTYNFLRWFNQPLYGDNRNRLSLSQIVRRHNPSCNDNYYKEHIKVEYDRNDDKFKDRVDNVDNMIDDSTTIGKQELSDSNNLELNKARVTAFKSINDAKSNTKTNIHNYYSQTGNHTSEEEARYSEIDTLDNYHTFQMKKKISRNTNDQTNKGKSNDLRFVSGHDSEYDPNEIYDEINLGNNDEFKQKFHDLFGDVHPWQESTQYTLVSRGFPDNTTTQFDSSPSPSVTGIGTADNSGYFHIDSVRSPPGRAQPFKSIICKSCPIPITQKYRFDPTLLGLDPNDPTVASRTKDYFVEMGGTYKADGSNKCKVCDYPKGCFSIGNDRTDKFEFKPCRNKQGRTCAKCTTCHKGEHKIKKFCGEGGGSENTECEPCTPCPDGTYKVYGCDRDNTAYDNVCVPMTTCFGKKTDEHPYSAKHANIQDPGKGNRTYQARKGVRGSNGYDTSIDTNDSYSKNDVIDETAGDDSRYLGYRVYQLPNNRVVTDPIYKETQQRQKDLDGNELKPPYYGKDRECSKCDTCLPGYIHLTGCMGENDNTNTICQRQIDIEKYLSKNLEDKVPKGKIYDKRRVIRAIIQLNNKLIRQDNEVRSYIFSNYFPGLSYNATYAQSPKTIHDNIPPYYLGKSNTKSKYSAIDGSMPGGGMPGGGMPGGGMPGGDMPGGDMPGGGMPGGGMPGGGMPGGGMPGGGDTMGKGNMMGGGDTMGKGDMMPGGDTMGKGDMMGKVDDNIQYDPDNPDLYCNDMYGNSCEQLYNDNILDVDSYWSDNYNPPNVGYILQQYYPPSRPFTMKNINDPRLYGDIPILSDDDLLRIGLVDCSKCEDGYFVNPNNKGCKNGVDTICVPHTKCKTDGTEMLSKKGTPTTDNICGKCICPRGYFGPNPKCNGTDTVEGCAPRKICVKDANTDEKLFYFDRPGDYGDGTSDNKCKKCSKECPVGTFLLSECEPGTNKDAVCKPHRECDKDTMLVVEPGTKNKDTICKCIDGFDWPSDPITGEKNMEAHKCESIKGECWKNPCHTNANCYDNFNSDGSFKNYVCRCDVAQGWIETQKLGKGPDGCEQIPNKHYHNVKDATLTPEESQQYEGTDPKIFGIRNHLKDDYHKNKKGTHIHKN